MSSESYHEPYEVLSEETTNMHRALVSVMEELEAIDWYQQRAEVCSDGELRAVLLHNREEGDRARGDDPGVDPATRSRVRRLGPALSVQ